LNLRDRIAIGGWEWKVQLDQDKDTFKYNYPLCGPISYFVVTDEPVPQQSDLVVKQGDILTFAPQLNHSPGTYNMLLVGVLDNYKDVQVSRQFSVVVTSCESRIIWQPAQLSVEDLWYEWSSPAYFYDITNTIAAYQQEPNCGYQVAYELSYGNLYDSPVTFTNDNPVAIQYDGAINTFKIEKCSDA
jgi:hypothetical protein